MSLKDQFADAQVRVKKLPKSPGNDGLLKLYSLYKQATTGDCSGKRPGMMDFAGRAKWDTWNGLKGKSADDAMQEYIDFVNSLGA
jgi:diazepam-binding inhibitor (GABA receptor modulator, acyl-CoA-binding protein)